MDDSPIIHVQRRSLTTRALILTLAATLALTACSGTMQGRVRGTGAAVPFTYEEGLESDTLTTVIDGESFQGKAVMKGAATTGTLFGPGWGMSTVTGCTATGTCGRCSSAPKGPACAAR